MSKKGKSEEVKSSKQPEEDGRSCFLDVKSVCEIKRALTEALTWLCVCVCVCVCVFHLYLCSLEGRPARISHAADPLPSKQLNPLEELSTGGHCTSKSIALATKISLHTHISTYVYNTHTHITGEKSYQTHRGGLSGPDGPS